MEKHNRTVFILLSVVVFVFCYIFQNPILEKQPTFAFHRTLPRDFENLVEMPQDATERCDNEVRRLALEQFCNSHRTRVNLADTRINVREHIEYAMTLDDERKSMVCALPKVASSTWMAFLVREHWPEANGTDIPWDTIPIHDPAFQKSLGIYHMTSFNRSNIIPRVRSYFNFMFVRHPMERLISAYKDKFIMTESGYRQYYRPYIMDHVRYGITDKPMAFYEKQEQMILGYIDRGEDIPEEFLQGRTPDESVTWYRQYNNGTDPDNPLRVTFSEFLHFVLNVTNDKRHDHHWQLMIDSCYPCDVNYDVIGRLETMDKDTESIIIRLNALKPLRSSAVDHLRLTNHSQGTQSAYTKTLAEYAEVDPVIVRRVKEMYKDDLGAFGYTFDTEDFTARCRIAWGGKLCC